MIRMIDVSTGYDYKSPLMQHFNHTFEDNKVYGIIGTSGCGKTTLLRTIVGLIKPLSGEIVINNRKSVKPHKSGIYMMHQGYTCFDWRTVIENVLIAKQVKGKVTPDDVENARHWLEAVHLIKHEDKYPTQLSGGMRQRLALARTLFMEPKIILMDEPLSALDEDLRAEMQNLLIREHRKTQNTIIMVTHSKDEARRLCDEVINLSDIKEVTTVE